MFGVVLGAGFLWGMTMPMAKVAVSTGYQHFGLLFWQLVFMIAFLLPLQIIRGRLVRYEWKHLPVILAIALFGAVIPNSFSYMAFAQLPAGVMAVLIATVPIFTLPIAAAIGLEQVKFRRAAGVILGLLAVVLLVGPENALNSSVSPIWVLIALIGPLAYACEDNAIAKLGLSGLGSIQALFGACILGLVLITPVTIASGQFINLWKPWTIVEFSILGATLFHVVAYAVFIWFIGVAGPVFASMVAYLVTGFGITASALLLGEQYSTYFWAAVGMMALAVFLVSPRQDEGHVEANA